MVILASSPAPPWASLSPSLSLQGPRTLGILFALRRGRRLPPGCPLITLPSLPLWSLGCTIGREHTSHLCSGWGHPDLTGVSINEFKAGAWFWWCDAFSEILLISNSTYLLTQKSKPKKLLQSQEKIYICQEDCPYIFILSFQCHCFLSQSYAPSVQLFVFFRGGGLFLVFLLELK